MFEYVYLDSNDIFQVFPSTPEGLGQCILDALQCWQNGHILIEKRVNGIECPFIHIKTKK